MMEDDPKLQPLGILWMVWSGFTTFVGVLLGAIFSGIGALSTVLPDESTGEPAPGWVGWLFGGFGLVFAGIFAVVGAIGFFAGMGVRKGKTWALIVVLILAFLQLSSFPLGTALGVYTFIVAFKALNEGSAPREPPAAVM